MLDVLKTIFESKYMRTRSKQNGRQLHVRYTYNRLNIFIIRIYEWELSQAARQWNYLLTNSSRIVLYFFFLVVLSWSERRCKWDRQTHFLLYFSYQNSFTVPLQLVWSSCHWSHKGIGRAFLEHPSQYVSIVNVFKRDSELNSGDECLKNHKILRQFYKFIR